jgi:hypothetical protein
VWNRIRETSQTTNGKVTKYTKTYYPAWFEIRKTKANTKGFKLEVSLPNAAFDSQGGVRGFWHGGYAWYNVERQAGAIQAIVSYMWERGYSQPTMTAKLTLSAEATGEVEIRAKDGKTTLRKKVTSRQTVEDYYFLDNISGKFLSLTDAKAGNFTNLIPAIDLILDDDPSGSWDWLTGAYGSDRTQTNIEDTFYWTENNNVIKSGVLVYTFHLSWWIQYNNVFGYPAIAGAGPYLTGTYGPDKDILIRTLMGFDWTVSDGFVNKSSIIYVFVYGDLVATLAGLDDEWEFCHVSDVNDLGSGACNIRPSAVFVSKAEFMVRMQHLTDNKFLWFTYKDGAMLESGKIDYSSSGFALGTMYHAKRIS